MCAWNRVDTRLIESVKFMVKLAIKIKQMIWSALMIPTDDSCEFISRVATVIFSFYTWSDIEEKDAFLISCVG